MNLGGLTGMASRANPAADHALAALQERAGNVERFHEVAQGFESIFMNMVLNSMRQTLKGPAYFGGGFGEGVWTRMLDTELSQQASQRDSGYGIANALIRKYEPYVR